MENAVHPDPDHSLLEDAARPFLLVVDDNPALRAVIAGALARTGAEVAQAGDGLEMLAAFQPHELNVHGRPPDLIVSDVQMPGCSGLLALQTLRELHIDTPVILMTSLCDEALRGSALAMGATAVLDKPVDMIALRALVRSVLAART